MNLKEMIIKLCSASGPSGFETPVRLLAEELIKPYVDETWTDAMGNLIAVRRCGRENARKLVLEAHMDEIGLIITGYEKGFLRFSSLGGIDPRMLPAREVRVLTTDPLYGVIDTMPPHVLSTAEMDKSLEADKLFIDVGMSEESVKKIPLGTPVVFAGGAEQLGADYICGKAMDDRACVAIIIKAMEYLQGKDLCVDVYALISTQEEVGLRGAKTGVFAINPQLAIAIDVTHAHTPDAKKHETLEMGKGVAIAVGPNMNQNITDEIIKIASEKEIPHQIEVVSGASGTDAWVIQVCREGVSTALLSLPVKYMHSPVETMNLDDASAIVRLVSEFAVKAGEVL